MYQHGTLANGTNNQNLRNPSEILSHTLCLAGDLGMSKLCCCPGPNCPISFRLALSLSTPHLQLPWYLPTGGCAKCRQASPQAKLLGSDRPCQTARTESSWRYQQTVSGRNFSVPFSEPPLKVAVDICAVCASLVSRYFSFRQASPFHFC